MRALRFSGRARSQLRAVARYLLERTDDIRAGERFVRDIEARMTRFAQLPGSLGRPRQELGDGIRSLPHQGYVVIFRYGDDSIDVLQVVHARRDFTAGRGGAED